jgi:hypothetical protein
MSTLFTMFGICEFSKHHYVIMFFSKVFMTINTIFAYLANWKFGLKNWIILREMPSYYFTMKILEEKIPVRLNFSE